MMTPAERLKTIEWLRAEAGRIEAHARENDRASVLAPHVDRLRRMADHLEEKQTMIENSAAGCGDVA